MHGMPWPPPFCNFSSFAPIPSVYGDCRRGARLCYLIIGFYRFFRAARRSSSARQDTFKLTTGETLNGDESAGPPPPPMPGRCRVKGRCEGKYEKVPWSQFFRRRTSKKFTQKQGKWSRFVEPFIGISQRKRKDSKKTEVNIQTNRPAWSGLRPNL